LQQAYFDIYAWKYDEHFTASLIGRAQRDIVHNYVSRLSNKNVAVLEVNCGTGQDALELGSNFKKWTCTDVSGEMIRICGQKLGNRCEALQSNMLDVGDRIGGKYDLIFSNFGGLNCLNQNEIRKFRDVCSGLCSENGELIFVVMGRKCIWERFYFGIKGCVRAKRREIKTGVKVNISGAEFPVFYYSPGELAHFFADTYLVKTSRPVGFFIPPTYLEPFFAKWKFLLPALRIFETLIASFGFLSNHSDHYLIHLKKK